LTARGVSLNATRLRLHKVHRFSLGLGHLCESGLSDRHRCPLLAAQNLNPGIDLLGKRLDDAGAEPSFCLSKDAPAGSEFGAR
jgi:hypothetical protein